jgi:hypothetical protein
MSTKFEFRVWPLDEVDDEAIEQGFQEYEIVWAAREFAGRDQQKMLH